MNIFIIITVLTSSFFMISSARADGDISVSNAWVRQVPPGVTVTAAYMTILNSGDTGDKLLGISTDASKSVELHESVVDDEGVVRMNMLQELTIPPGSEVALKPGEMHLMLIDIMDPMEHHEKVTFVLEFKKAGSIEVEAAVGGPGSHDDGKTRHHMH